jgi:uncharacterized protein (DUF2132 family)
LRKARALNRFLWSGLARKCAFTRFARWPSIRSSAKLFFRIAAFQNRESYRAGEAFFQRLVRQSRRERRRHWLYWYWDAKFNSRRNEHGREERYGRSRAL